MRRSKTKSKLSITTWNTRGLITQDTRDVKLTHILKYNSDVVCLIDSHLKEKHLPQLRRNYISYNIYSNTKGPTSSRGILVMIKKSKDFGTQILHQSEDGNLLILKLEYEGNNILLAATYAPNEDNPTFFNDLATKLEALDYQYKIITGDFNLTIDPKNETHNYVNERNNINARNRFTRMIEDNDLEDPFYYSSYQEPHFTWVKDNGNKLARLDRFLVSPSMSVHMDNYRRFNRGPSDHHPINISIDFSKFTGGKGYWKMPTYLLTNTDYIEKCKQELKISAAKYAVASNSRQTVIIKNGAEYQNFLEKSFNEIWNHIFTISHCDLFDMIINDIRLFTQKYVQENTTQNRNELNQIEATIHELEMKRDNNPDDPVIMNLIDECRTEYEIHLDDKKDKKKYAVKLMDKIVGDRITPELCVVDKNVASQRYIAKLIKRITVNGTVHEIVYTDPAEIDNIIKEFYMELYKKKEEKITIHSIEDFLLDANVDIKQITAEQNVILNADITRKELKDVLDRSKNGSSPGPTGITYGWYKVFWECIEDLMLKVARNIFLTSKLPKSQNYGTICLLPKQGKDKFYIENWRPLTLLSVGYKLISGVIAKRINDCLETIIHIDQNGFVPKRNIADSLRNTQDIIEYTKLKKRTGMLLLVDFKKAFDSIHHKFIYSSLRFFGFCESIVKWIEILIGDFYVSTNNGGRIGERFQLGQGCKQGDPISSALFIIAIEILCIKLRKTQELKGLKIEGIKFLLSLFADDLTIFMEHDEQQLRLVVNILNNFKNLSGLEIQISKTQLTVFGKKPQGGYKICEEINLQYKSDFKLLGILFDVNKDIQTEQEQALIKLISKKAKHWSFRMSTPLGRAEIAKTYLLSQLNHYNSVHPISDKAIDEIRKIILWFIYKSKVTIGMYHACARKAVGGFAFPDVRASMIAYNFSWIRKIYYNLSESTRGKPWMKILEQQIDDVRSVNRELDDIKYFGIQDFLELAHKTKGIKSKFWKDIFNSAAIVLTQQIRNDRTGILAVPWTSIPDFKRIVPRIDENGNASYHQTEVLMTPRKDFSTLNRMGHGNGADMPYNLIIFRNKNIAGDKNRFLQYDDEFGVLQGHTVAKIQYNDFKEQISRYIDYYKQDFEHCREYEKPLLEEIILNQGRKGCNKFKMIMIKKYDEDVIARRNTIKVEWQQELSDDSLDEEFLKKKHTNLKNLNFDNNWKWIQAKILTRSLETNERRYSWKPHALRVPRERICRICNHEPETMKHIFWTCPHTADFIRDAHTYLRGKHQSIPTSIEMNGVLFGHDEQHKNIFYAILRQYIWQECWLKKKAPALNTFKSYYIHEIKLLIDLANSGGSLNRMEWFAHSRYQELRGQLIDDVNENIVVMRQNIT